MLRDITIGQHFPGNSVLHRCDPRLKLVATIAYIVVLFVAPNPLGLALSIALLAALYKVAKIPGKLILKSLKPIVPIVLFTAVLNLFFVTGEGEPLVHIWVLKIYGEGIRYAILLTVRVCALIAGTSLLTYTTSPIVLTDAIENLLRPLAKIHFPVHELAMMMTIALRFIPTLIEETEKIMNAQKARGAMIDNGTFTQRIKALVLFVAPNPLGLALSIALLAALYKVAKIPGKLILKSLKPIVPIVLFTAVLNLFFVTGEGEPLVHIWVLKIYGEGIRYAILLTVRVCALIAGTSLLTYTTSPIVLTDAIENLLRPLAKIHFPVHELAMMMTIALRFIPTLIEETEKIMNAQKARGAMIDNGTFTQRIKALVPVLIPLFISAFRRADELAMAMECRCYHGGEGRTRLKQLKFTAEDTRCAVIITATLLVICATRFFVPGLA